MISTTPNASGSPTLARLRDVLRATFKTWLSQRVASKGASLAFYALLSLPPTLILTMMVAGHLLPGSLKPDGITQQTQSLLGTEAGAAVSGIVAAISREDWNATSGVVALVTLLMGASAAFAELKGTLDELWGVDAKAAGPGIAVGARLQAIGLSIMLAFLGAVSLLLSALLAGLAAHPNLPWHASDQWVAFASTASTFVALWALFATVYKTLPAARLAWRDVMLGALLTATLFLLGKWLIGRYLGSGTEAARFGAAGPVVTLLLWVYYASQLFLLGAIFTRHYAMRICRGVV